MKKKSKKEEPEYFTIPEAAKALGCHPNKIRALIRKEALVPVYMGADKVPMIPVSQVEAMRTPLADSGAIIPEQPAAWPLVAIGCSAGITPQLKELLSGLPEGLGLPFMIMVDRRSSDDLERKNDLQAATHLPVVIVEQDMKLTPDRIHLVPQGKEVFMVNGVCRLQQNPFSRAGYKPIDRFFRSLGVEFQGNAIGVLLPDTGTDGIEGLRSIKAGDGMTIVGGTGASRPGTKTNASLKASGIIDMVVEPREIGRELIRILDKLYSGDGATRTVEKDVKRILHLVHEKKGIDFNRYKQATVDRRVVRRMILSQSSDLPGYFDLLNERPDEVDNLVNDLLINVTSFFRDQKLFEALRKKVLPELLRGRTAGDALRIWVPACAGGEEVVSIAITLLEVLGEHALTTPVQIFATDLNERTIEKARLGVYRAAALSGLSRAQLKRFFIPVDGHYQVIKSIRDMCVFARHDLIKDPPFSRLDLISCQNVLIYLENSAQAQVLKNFHYALKSQGFLLLGKAETPVPAGDIFSQMAPDVKVYQRRMVPGERPPMEFRYGGMRTSIMEHSLPGSSTVLDELPDLDREAEKVLLREHVPASVIVNKDLDIVRFNGDISGYLGPSSGRASLGLLKMLRREISVELRQMLYRARREKIPLQRSGISARSEDKAMDLKVDVVPILPEIDLHFLVIFREIPIPALPSPPRKGRAMEPAMLRVRQLEAELQEAREQMRLIADESETANQELQSANEEIVSSNEELQSINEELETSKEELQSINEEFATINDELQVRNDALLASEQRLRESEERYRELMKLMPVGIYACDAQGYITYFNEAASRIWGRVPVSGTDRWCGAKRLYQMDGSQIDLSECAMADVLRTGVPRAEVEVIVERPDGERRQLVANPTPLFDAEGKISGALNVLIDVTERRHVEAERQQLAGMLERSLNEIYIFDLKTLKFEYVNHGALSNLGYTLDQMREITPVDIKPEFTAQEFDRAVKPLRTGEKEKLVFYTVHRRADGSDYPVEVHLQTVNNGEKRMFMAMILDITERRLGEERLRVATQAGKLGIWDWDVEKDTITWTDPVYEIHGVHKDSFEPSLPGYTELIHPEDRERVGKAIQHTLVNDAPYEMEFRTFNNKGEVNWVYTSGVVLRDKGRPVRMLGGTMNITKRKLVEEDARKLAAIVETSQDAIVSADLQGNITSWNKGCERIYGYTADEILGKKVSTLMPEDRRPEQTQVLERIRNGERIEPFESQRMRKDGSLVDLAITLSPIIDEQGRMTGISKIAHDISDRKRAEAEQRETQGRFELLADNMDQLAWIGAADGSTMWFNKRWEEFSGIPVDQIRDRAETDLHHPDHYERVVTSLRACAERGEAWECNFPLKSRNGEWRWFLSRALPVKDENGVVFRWFGTSTDITEQQEAQEILRHNEERFHLLADSMDQLAWIADADGQLTWYNSRWYEYTGTKPGETSGDGWRKVIPEDHMERVAQVWGEAVKARNSFELEFPLIGGNGEQRMFLSRANAVKNDQGKVLQWFGTLTDITELKRTEELIRESENRFRTMVDQLPHSLQIIDPQGRIVRVNRAWERLFGVTIEEIRDYVLFEDQQLIQSGIMGLIQQAREGVPVEFPPNRYIPDRGENAGKEIWTRGIMYPVKNEEGVVRELVLIHEDHTARRHAEEALRESEGRLRAAFEQSAAGFALTDTTGRFMRVNEYFCQMLGYTQEELLDMRMQDVTHPEDVPGNVVKFKESVAHGTRFDIEKRYMRKDGADVWVHVSVAPIADANGTIDRILGVSVDLTERKKAEALRQESETRFRQMANNAPVLIWISDTDGNGIWFNNAWLEFVGRPMEKETGPGWAENIHPEDRERTLEVYHDSFKGPHPFTMDYRLRRHDGEYRWFFDNGTPMFDGNGEFIGYIGSCIDIHDRKEAEHALAESARQKDQFLATLAHELRNPLAPIRNGLQLLEMAGDDPEVQHTTRAMMERQMNHLVRLVDDLMDLSRISRGKIELRREAADLVHIVEVAVESCRPAINGRGHELVLSLPKQPVVIDGDPMRLTQSVANLVNNAAKYTPPGGRIEVALETIDGEARIKVKDNGIGIDPEALPTVFEMFSQVDTAQKTDPGGGLGIGLNIVQKLCELHGGRVTGRSEGRDKGSEFIMSLPLLTGKIRAGGAPTNGTAGHVEPQRILVVDDNQDAAMSMTLILRRLGHTVEVAHDGVQAVSMAEQMLPDVIFMDIGMPLKNGYEACAEIRRSPQGGDVFLIALSGWGQQRDQDLSKEAGFDAHYVKPLAPADLGNILVSAVARRQEERGV